MDFLEAERLRGSNDRGLVVGIVHTVEKRQNAAAPLRQGLLDAKPSHSAQDSAIAERSELRRESIGKRIQLLQLLPVGWRLGRALSSSSGHREAV